MIFIFMQISIKELRRLISEAVIDHMRTPRGHNSRDDAEDRPLEDDEKDDEIDLEEKC